MATDLAIAVAPLLPPVPMRLAGTSRLPDVLRDNLDVIFVGTAAGRRSAASGVYYAHPGNYFWRTLWQVGLTPRRFAPRDFAKLRDVGIGFTDLSKSGCGMDHEIAADQFDVAAFEAKMRRHQPRAIAFTSKKAASLWLRRRTDRIAYGRQKLRPADFCEVFVSPRPLRRRDATGSSSPGAISPIGSARRSPGASEPCGTHAFKLELVMKRA